MRVVWCEMSIAMAVLSSAFYGLQSQVYQKSLVIRVESILSLIWFQGKQMRARL